MSRGHNHCCFPNAARNRYVPSAKRGVSARRDLLDLEAAGGQ